MIITLCVIILFAFFSFRIEKTLLGPSTLFFIIWIIAITAYMSDIFYFHSADQALINVLLLFFSCFFFGFIMANIVNYQFSSDYKRVDKPASKSENFTIDLFFKFLLVVLILRASSIMIDLLIVYGSLTLVFLKGDEIYQLSRHGDWSAGFPVFIPVEALSAFFLSLRYSRSGRLDRWSKLAIFAIITIIVLNQSRYTLYVTFLSALAPLYSTGIHTKRIPLLRLTGFLTLIILITFSRNLVMFSEGSITLNEFLYAGQLNSLIFYLGGGIAGLNEYLKTGVDEFSGLYSLNGLKLAYETLSGQSGLAFKYDPVIYYTPYPNIIATSIRYLYDDFGQGMYIIIFVLGALTRFNVIFTKFSSSPTPIVVSSWIYFFLGNTFFGYAPFLMSFWLYCLFTLAFAVIAHINK